jgi:pimeloyl-ACP methyl ester carboxylesterase
MNQDPPLDAGWTQDDLLVGDVSLHYYRTGQGAKRPLVLVHGFSDSGLCWSRTARDLEAEYDVVMPDMRGHGLSERMRPGDEVDMAADLAGLIRGLGLNRPMVCGHSMGAAVTFQTCVRFPDLAAAVVLEDPPWWLSLPFQPIGPSDENPMSLWAKGLADQTLDQLLAENREQHPEWPDETVGFMAESKKQLDQGIIDTLIDKLNSGGSDWLAEAANVSPPVLLLTANPQLGAIITPEVEARVRELNPGWTIVGVPDVGHLIHYDNYDAFIGAVRAFLEHVPA